MFIDEQEYFELKEQARILNERIRAMEKPSTFSVCVEEMPYGYIRNVVEGKPIFRPDQNTHDEAWKLFNQLGKVVHKNVVKCKKTASYCGKPYIRTVNNQTHPRTLDCMTKEQFELSARMLNELIPIYNRYFEEANKYVLYDACGNGAYEAVPIFYQTREE